MLGNFSKMLTGRSFLFLQRHVILGKGILAGGWLEVSNIHLRTRPVHVCSLLRRERLLSDEKITEILQVNEFTQEFNDENCSIKYYESNQLRSNSPIEDARAEGQCLLTGGILMGVFDGHSGPECAQAVAKRLFDYICVSFAPNDLLSQYCNALEDGQPLKLVELYNESLEFDPELKAVHRNSLIRYIKMLLSGGRGQMNSGEALKKAIIKLDEDISTEALQSEDPQKSAKVIRVAMAGAVACVVYIHGSDLYVANIGDCRAVLGQLTKNNTWVAKQLTCDHNYDNSLEVSRIIGEHPPNECRTVIRMGRLLGQLAPLRAFGDVVYKWSKDDLIRLVVPLYGNVIPANYHTPPYLTAKPEISHHRLTTHDKFLILASDGLWDELRTPTAIQLVADHRRGKKVLDPVKLPLKSDIKLIEINRILLQRKKYFILRPVDRNGATHLIRKALAPYGFERSKENEHLSRILSLDHSIARCYHDDITTIVVYFDSTRRSFNIV